MKETISKLDQQLQIALNYLDQTTEAELELRPVEGKWSKKEILGHLIDSAYNNIRRFNEIQFEAKPYKIIKYNQVALVKSNNYQNADIAILKNLWLTLNTRVLEIIKNQTEETLNYKIELEENEFSDLRFLMTDYVEHLAHHVRQIQGVMQVQSA